MPFFGEKCSSLGHQGGRLKLLANTNILHYFQPVFEHLVPGGAISDYSTVLTINWPVTLYVLNNSSQVLCEQTHHLGERGVYLLNVSTDSTQTKCEMAITTEQHGAAGSGTDTLPIL